MKKNLALLFIFLIQHSGFAQTPLTKMWDKRYGGSEEEWLFAFKQTSDGGYILGGISMSDSSGDKTQPNWDPSLTSYDYWIVKLDSMGNKIWDKRFGGISYDAFYDLKETSDKGFILAGNSTSGLSGDKSQNTWGTYDYWVVKIDSSGTKQWDRDFGGFGTDELRSIQQTWDNGYLLAGKSTSGIGGDKTQPLRDSCAGCIWAGDYWVIKIDSLGNKLWDRDFGGSYQDLMSRVEITYDGGFILGGYTFSGVSVDKTQPNWDPTEMTEDYWIIKCDSLGNKEWDKRFGGISNDRLNSVLQTYDGGYLLAGWSASGISGDKSQQSWGAYDYWIVKIDSLGNKLWDRDFGGSNSEVVDGIIQTLDSGYLIAGISQSSISGDKTESNLGQGQTWIVKIDSLGNKIWDKTIFSNGSDDNGFAMNPSSGCYTTANRSNGGIAGYKSEPSQGSYDYWIVKLCDSTLTTNIPNTEKTNDQLLLWPNPTKGELKISNSELKIDLIEIFNIIGERLYFEKSNCESCIVNCASFPSGIYFLKIISGEKIFIEKFIKE